MSIYKKLVEIRKDIGGFKKDTKGFNYSYVSGTQVLSKVIDKMDELNVLLVSSIVPGSKQSKIFEYDSVNKKGEEKHNIEYIVEADMIMKWIDADEPNETLEVTFALYGQQDDISKAFGSGLTYSERYFLMKFFNVPTDADDPDAKQEKPQSKQISNNKISEAQLKRLWAIGHTKGFEPKVISNTILKRYNKQPSELTKQEYDETIKLLEDKPNK